MKPDRGDDLPAAPAAAAAAADAAAAAVVADVAAATPNAPVEPVAAVGPVLSAGPVADAIVAAIQKENVGVRVTDRGSYLRVAVPERCQVSRAGIEAALNQAHAFRLPGDLERVMPSFSGHFQVSEDAATWVAGVQKS